MAFNKQNIGYLVGWLSAGLNVLLFAIKYWAGTTANSIAMTADAWHTLTDTFTSVIVIVGIWIGSKPPDKNHPYGHGRAESIAAIIIATILAMIAFDFVVEGVNRINNPVSPQYSIFVLLVFSLSILLKEAMAQISYRVGKKINSDSLRADGWHHRSDAITTLVIVVGAIFGKEIVWLDGALAIAVALLILYAAVDILKNSANFLLGRKASKQLKKEIVEIINNSDSTVSDIHNLKIHDYGGVKELTLHIRLPRDLRVDESHRISKKMEELIYEKKNIVATIHVEPQMD